MSERLCVIVLGLAKQFLIAIKMTLVSGETSYISKTSEAYNVST